MADALTFHAETFLALPIKERVKMCKQLAEHAQQLADAAAPHHRKEYLDIAKSWLQLADEMERVEAMENKGESDGHTLAVNKKIAS